MDERNITAGRPRPGAAFYTISNMAAAVALLAAALAEPNKAAAAKSAGQAVSASAATNVQLFFFLRRPHFSHGWRQAKLRFLRPVRQAVKGESPINGRPHLIHPVSRRANPASLSK